MRNAIMLALLFVASCGSDGEGCADSTDCPTFEDGSQGVCIEGVCAPEHAR